jgi:hypothetical protein
MNSTILWKRKAVKQFADAIEYIRIESTIYMPKFEREILKKIDERLPQTERYQLIN